MRRPHDATRGEWREAVRRVFAAARIGGVFVPSHWLDEMRDTLANPIPMVLHCPLCAMQHIDAPNPARGWENKPHRSHECQGCGHVWRPADVDTTGVRAVSSQGKRDTAIVRAFELD